MSKVQNIAYKREKILKEQKGLCALCNQKVINPTIDHILPRSMGGKNHTDNLQVACRVCNHTKADNVFLRSHAPAYAIVRYLAQGGDEQRAIDESKTDMLPFLQQYKRDAITIKQLSSRRVVKSLVLDNKIYTFVYHKRKKEVTGVYRNDLQA